MSPWWRPDDIQAIVDEVLDGRVEEADDGATT